MSSQTSDQNESGSTNRGGALVGLLIAAFGALYLWQVTVIPRGAAHTVVPPWGFPLFVGIVLTVVGLLLFLNGCVRSLREKNSPPREEAGNSEAIDWRSLAGVAVSMVLYTWLWTVLGFVVSSLLLLLVVGRLFGSRAWKRDVIYSILFTGVIYAIFVYGIGIRLPSGSLFSLFQ